MKIALISCTKLKKVYRCPARELYSESQLFSLSYRYAKNWADKIYILSAKHGLIAEDCILDPYNKTLNDMERDQQLLWAENVLTSMDKVFDLQNDEFMILAGNNYLKDLIPHLRHYMLPLKGLNYEKRIEFLKNALDNKDMSASSRTVSPSLCRRIHKLLNSLPRYSWNEINSVPFLNGIYIIFEKGEVYCDMDRIVRVGTHTSPNRLRNRLADHFIKEDHEGSIFRKNIGRVILYAHHDPYLTSWELNSSFPQNACRMDPAKTRDIEIRVSKFLRENFTFTVFPVKQPADRLRLEEAIIAALNQCPDFSPSSHWAGQYSPEAEIRASGMWLKQGLDGRPLTETEFLMLKGLCHSMTGSYSENSDTIDHKNGSSSENPYHGKYLSLYQYLCAQDDAHIILTFSEIENILGFPLPDSAETYAAWWTPALTHTQCNAWTMAGFQAVNVEGNLINQQMEFLKY